MSKAAVKYLLMTVLFMVISFVVPVNPLSAETINFVKEYTYQASELDSKSSCRMIALVQIKRLLLEELGTYLESTTEVKNFELTKDQIETISAGVVKTEILSEKWNGVTYYIKAKITVDPEQVNQSISAYRSDNKSFQEIASLKKQTSKLINDIEQIKEELRLKKNTQGESIKKYNAGIQSLSKLTSLDYYSAGRTLAFAGKYDEAVSEYGKAIEISPENVIVYVSRGEAYISLKRYSEAINDFSKAIELSPDNEMAYRGRGNAYENSGDAKQALSDYDKCISLNPHDKFAYFGRGVANAFLGLSGKAMEDFTKAIEIDSSFAVAYQGRALAYSSYGDMTNAIKEFTKAAQLGDTFSQKVLRANNWTAKQESVSEVPLDIKGKYALQHFKSQQPNGLIVTEADMKVSGTLEIGTDTIRQDMIFGNKETKIEGTYKAAYKTRNSGTYVVYTQGKEVHGDFEIVDKNNLHTHFIMTQNGVPVEEWKTWTRLTE